MTAFQMRRKGAWQNLTPCRASFMPHPVTKALWYVFIKYLIKSQTAKILSFKDTSSRNILQVYITMNCKLYICMSFIFSYLRVLNDKSVHLKCFITLLDWDTPSANLQSWGTCNEFEKHALLPEPQQLGSASVVGTFWFDFMIELVIAQKSMKM